MKLLRILSLTLIIGLFLVCFIVFPQMPERMVSHWNINGQPDGYSPRFWGLFLFPLISFLIFVLSQVFIRVDPLRKNIKGFEKHFNIFILVLILFFAYICGFSILYNLGAEIDISKVMPPALGALLFYVGVLLGKTKRNWFVGIRTPWTMSSDRIWEKTHALGGKAFKILAILIFFSFLVGGSAFYLILGSTIFMVVFLFVYSYIEYNKDKKE